MPTMPPAPAVGGAEDTIGDRSSSPPQSVIDRAATDYTCGEITLAYDRVTIEDGRSRRNLVFAVAELLHAGLESGPERPTGEGDWCKRFEGGTHELNVRRVVYPVVDTLEWYRACAAGRANLPQTADERARGAKPLALELPPFDEEPTFPNVVFDGEEEFWSGSRFWGSRPGGTRRHQLVSQDPALAFREWTERGREEARSWLKAELPVDVLERPLLTGSVHLLLTNPVFGEVHVRLNGDTPTQVHMALQRWPGRPLPRLKVFMRDDRPTGPAFLREFDLAGPSMTIDLPQEPHQFSCAISSERDGLLFASQPATFIRQIAIQRGVVGSQRRVEVPARSRARGAEQYSVHVASVETQHIGERPLNSAMATLVRDSLEAEQRREATRRDQRWFDGDVDGATNFIRDLVANAHTDVLIVDPYFGFTEALRFAFAPKIEGAKVRILTSREYLGRKRERDEQQAQHLKAVVDDLARRDPTLTIEVRVARGERAPVHDRFIVVDHRVAWLVGSSLNEFGSRGTMTVRLPYVAPVLLALEKHWDASPTLDAWLAEAGNQTKETV
jgi:hypothetical protein